MTVHAVQGIFFKFLVEREKWIGYSDLNNSDRCYVIHNDNNSSRRIYIKEKIRRNPPPADLSLFFQPWTSIGITQKKLTSKN